MSRFHFLVAVHAFFIRNGKVLLLKRQNTGYCDGWYAVPAGHVDGGEEIAAAMKREIEEETGIIISERIEPDHVMHRIISDAEERIDYFFMIEEWHGEPTNTEPEKCEELEWFEKDYLPEKVIPYLRFSLDMIDQGKKFSEFDQ